MFWRDREIVMYAVKDDGWEIDYASKYIWRYREIVMDVLKDYGSALKFT